MSKRYTIPTAANLVGFTTMALTGYLANIVYERNIEDLGTAFPGWVPLAGAMMFGVVGWAGLGPKPGFGGSDSISKGLLYVIAATVYTCILYGMFFQAQALLRGEYLDPRSVQIVHTIHNSVVQHFRIARKGFLDLQQHQ